MKCNAFLEVRQPAREEQQCTSLGRQKRLFSCRFLCVWMCPPRTGRRADDSKRYVEKVVCIYNVCKIRTLRTTCAGSGLLFTLDSQNVVYSEIKAIDLLEVSLVRKGLVHRYTFRYSAPAHSHVVRSSTYLPGECRRIA